LSTSVDDDFWSRWRGRFVGNHHKYITPENELVRQVSEKAKDENILDEPHVQAWKYVAETVRYRLSKEWKTPQETIVERTGDCEDVDFLVASMLPHFGINKFKLKIGYLNKSSGSREAHTWLVVGGEVVDPTAMPEQIVEHGYEPIKEITINARR